MSKYCEMIFELKWRPLKNKKRKEVICKYSLTKAYGDNELVGEDSKTWSEKPVEPAEDLELDDLVEFRPPTTGSKNLPFLATAFVTSTSSSSSLESSKKDNEKCWLFSAREFSRLSENPPEFDTENREVAMFFSQKNYLKIEVSSLNLKSVQSVVAVSSVLASQSSRLALAFVHC